MSLAQNQQQIRPQFNVNWITPDNFTGRNSNWNLSGSNASLNNHAESSSSLDVINNNNLSSQQKERLKAYLPGYRPAPDYETAVHQQKYRTSEMIQPIHVQPYRVASDPHINIYSGSHPDVHRATERFDQQLQQTPDVTQSTNGVYQQLFDPNARRLDGLSQQLQMMRINKRPPPYPVNRFNSASTPDLLSTKFFVNSQYTTRQQSSNIFRCRHSQSDNGNLNSTNLLSQKFQKVFDDGINQQRQGGSCHQLNGSIEPIYENQIYVSQTDVTNGKIRDRASSVQSSAGIKQSKQPYQRHLEHITAIKARGPVATIQHQALQNSQSLESITSRTSTTPIEHSRLNRKHVQFEQINRSQSTNVLDSYASANDPGVNNSKEKKKRRWKFWGGRGKISLSDKVKGGKSGRDKTKTYQVSLTKEEESDSRHRWSTGLPRLPLTTTISKDKLCQILETKLADPQLYIEFERIPKRKANSRYDCALHEENRLQNFDPNFLPYDDNRVRLTPTRENRLGYYNASYVSATVGSKQLFYIVAQSPHVAAALNMFLQCVWEADVYLLVQLSDEVNYVPPTSGKCLEYGQYQIWKEFSEVTERCITSKLRIYHTQSRRYRSVWHVKYCEWAEQNCPKDVGQFLEFLEELRSVRLASINEVPPGHNQNPPVLIHCSEGGGRTGVTLAADLFLYIMDHNQDLDIPRVLSQLREQRDNIVPSLAQYKFVYALLINYLKHSRLI